MKSAANSAAIGEWKNAVLALSDKRFFALMRLYLGAVKTPFSKHKLVDSLCSFLQKQEVRANILGCLDLFDLEIVSAVYFLNRPDRQKLAQFFLGSRSYPEIYSRILNMEERLLIFRQGEDSAGYRLNPVFGEELESRADFALLVSPVLDGADFAQDKAAPLEASAPPDILVKAMKRLSLLRGKDGSLVPDFNARQAFDALSAVERTAWLCAAASFPNAASTVLARKAAAFAQLAKSLVPSAFYSADAVERLFFLIEDSLESRELAHSFSASPAAGGQSRFSLLMESAEHEEAEERAISQTEAAVYFGLLIANGAVFSLNSDIFAEAERGAPASGKNTDTNDSEGAGQGGERRFVFQMRLPECRGRLITALSSGAAASPKAAPGIEFSVQLQNRLLAKLKEIDMSRFARSVLEERIRQKTVVSEKQLAPDAVRFEKSEASRLDFSGKRMLAQEACREGRLLEIITDEGLKAGAAPERFILRPERIDKNAVSGSLEPDGIFGEFSLSRAVSVKILPQPLFSD